MINTNYFKNKKITVVGLARSGIACANLLFSLGAKVKATDNNDSEITRRNAVKLCSDYIAVEFGKHSSDFIEGSDLVVVSPGVSNDSFSIQFAQKNNIPIVSEIEIASILCPAPIIAVTGSNGKTTVTTLISRVINASGMKAYACGNIGNPFCGEIQKLLAKDYVVLEVSSFQLERIKSFKPKIAVILNFNRNHLDRHKDMEEYLTAKKRIFLNQDKNDFLVLNGLDPALKNISSESKSKVIFFNQLPGLNPNQAAVFTVASILGIKDDIVSKTFQDFKGLEHRMEFVAEIKEVSFINDSKATTADSAAWALENINRPVFLIAGGKDKGVDYAKILESRQKIKEVILIGEAKNKIRQALGETLSFREVDSLSSAVRLAFSKAKAGDCVLLSPMCASFDMFKDYEERGRIFKEVVEALKKENGT